MVGRNEIQSMDPTLEGAWIGAVAGVVLWGANILWTLLWTERRARKRIRTMLRLEMDDNRAAVQQFLAAVEAKAANTQQSPGMDPRHFALSTVGLPTFSHRIWETLTDSIPIALDEAEIAQVHLFHNYLDELVRLKGMQRNDLPAWVALFEQVISDLMSIRNLLGPVPTTARAMVRRDSPK